MTNKRIVNIRITFVAFVGLMLGILFGFNWYLNRIKTTLAIVMLVGVLMLCVAIIIYAIKTKSYNEKIEYRKNISKILFVSSIVFFVVFILGTVSIIFPVSKANNIRDFYGTVKVNGVVCDNIVFEDTSTRFLIKDAVVDNGEEQVKVDYKIVVYTTKNFVVNLGDQVAFETELESFHFDTNNGKKIFQGVGYSCYVGVDKCEVEAGKQSFKDIIKNSTYQNLISNLNYDNANISYAILFGDKQGLSQDLSDMFSYAGISHILAVSGLHIGVLVSAIMFILKKIKMNKFVRLGILSAILVFYSYLCSFTPSVCRASIMAIVLTLCDIYLIEYDSLSSLSIAGLIILAFSPFALFTISFQLSFLCIFAIISLAPTLSKMLEKIKLPKVLASSLALSIATNLAILPVGFNNFAKVSLLGIITNIFVLPIFSITYVLLFVVAFVSLILPFMGFLLKVPELFLHIIKTIADYVSNIKFGIFKIFNVSFWTLTLILIISIILHFFMIKKYIKFGLSFVLTSLLITMFLMSAIPNNYSNDNLIFVQNYKGNVCYYVEDNIVTLIGSNIKNSRVVTDLKNLHIKNIDNIIAYDLQLNSLNNLVEICNDNSVKNIYVPSDFNYSELSKRIPNINIFELNVEVGSLRLETVHYDGYIIAVYLKTSLGTVLIPEIKPNKKEARFLMDNFSKVDILYLNNTDTNLGVYNISHKRLVCNKSLEPNVISLDKTGFYILNKYKEGFAL